jgi:predicted Rossmann fold flavoprotein
MHALPMSPVVVVGAGAAGLAAAIFARESGHAVTVIETTGDGGRKILISGGGRCNVLPHALEPKRFVSDSPAPLVQRLLRSWPLKGQRAFFERDIGVPLTLEAESRKWFPVSNRARDVRDGLVQLARRRGVVFQFNTELVDIRASAAGWQLDTNRGVIDASAVVLATGGLSVPATGSTGTGLRLARALGHVVHDTYAALTPLVESSARHAHLAGVSLDVRLRATSSRGSIQSEGGFLFTHRGYSGPSVLDVSHVAVLNTADERSGAAIRVRWCELDATEWHRELINVARLGGTSGLVLTAVTRRLPHRLAEQLARESGIALDRRAAELRREERATLVDRLTAYELPWTGDEGYKKAEVTGGGVSLEEVDPVTLESRRHPRLFLCGEMLDAFGPIGGHNFAWAWATGRLAGLGAAASTSSSSSVDTPT